ncbi:tegument serine/threonine protein kinase [Beluga whale alphaherpesvirus 1]|uniref:Tegument serine/threonine protein kinase n=1 Tax=Beluga whale alphaherpesvirus 1 TaxID=1434720 RepID=A0A286MM68_9ALPH|nr:tegument serine/threonine protein kinase [Beluga whale alphaherpesvirus 1]ASW27094.1 tegument serine/threonine protein kinase [Beluga whale alphaherpesvirus 1]
MQRTPASGSASPRSGRASSRVPVTWHSHTAARLSRATTSGRRSDARKGASADAPARPRTKDPPVLARPPVGKRRASAVVRTDRFLTLKTDASTRRPVFEVLASLSLRKVAFPEAPVFCGKGSYGRVEIFRAARAAVKTFSNGHEFAHELVATLLAADGAQRAARHLYIHNIIRPSGFCLDTQQLVLPAYDMDLAAYTRRLSRAQPSIVICQAAHRAFVDLGRAVVFLNSHCGLTHLDIKGGNVFVNVAGNTIVTAVLADFSLMTLNTHSPVAKADFDIPEEDQMVRYISTPATMLKTHHELVVGHCATRPSELLVDYINEARVPQKPRTLSHDLGLAIDLYSLGHTLLELVVGGCVRRHTAIKAFHKGLLLQLSRPSPELALEVLAYRCVFNRAVFRATPLTTMGGVPWDSQELICRALADAAHKKAFRDLVVRFAEDYGEELRGYQPPAVLHSLLELATLLCHPNPAARHAAHALWP